MKVLIVSRYKEQYATHVLPFVAEQTASLREEGCEVEMFLLQGNYYRQWKLLRVKIREFRPDVIHAHYGLTCLVANLATRRVPVVSTYHGSDINEPKVLPFSKVAMWLSAWNIFVSQRNVDIAKPHKHWSLIPCGVALSDDQLQSRNEARKALGWTTSAKEVLFAGAFDTEVKDSELAKHAVAMLNNEVSRTYELKEPHTIDDIELIELKGYSRSEVNRLMCAVDCLLMTSKTEGSPQVIKEAMACGCPIVSVDVGDVAERTEGVSGCYVVKSREPREIAAAIEKALVFKGRTNGRDKIIEYGLTNELVAKQIIEIYNRVIGKRYKLKHEIRERREEDGD